MSSSVRVRFAPSPTGMFHVGSARTALFNWLYARQHGGTFILRIEDTDESRNQPEWVDGILSALRWLELDWDEGPVFQSASAAEHLDAADALFKAGRAYYCDCTPEQRTQRLEARGGPPGYDGYCRERGLTPGPGRALRFRSPDEGVTSVHDVVRGDVTFPNANIEDFVIVKSNGGPTFVLANAVDDRAMEISHIVRGEDHLSNTPKAMLLWDALGAGEVPVFAHLPLLVNEARKKLSKRRDRVSLEAFRDDGYVMEALRNYLCLLGWSPGGDREVLTLDEMIGEFRLEHVVNSPAFFDVKKLTAFNERYLRAFSHEEFVQRSQPYLALGLWRTEDFDSATFARMVPLIQERVRTLVEVPAMVDFVFLRVPVMDPASWERAVAGFAPASTILAAAATAYGSCAWDATTLHDVTQRIGEAHGIALGKAQAPIRVAVTGRTVGPPLFESLEILGRERTLERLTAAQERIAAA